MSSEIDWNDIVWEFSNDYSRISIGGTSDNDGNLHDDITISQPINADNILLIPPKHYTNEEENSKVIKRLQEVTEELKSLREEHKKTLRVLNKIADSLWPNYQRLIRENGDNG